MKKFTWLIYPIAVLFVVFSSSIFLLGSGKIVQDMLAKKSQVVKVNKLKSDLENKLNVLKNTNAEDVLNDLREILQTVPAEKQAWVLIREIRQSVDPVTGSSLTGYRTSDSASSETLALTMTITTPDIRSLLEIIKSIEQKRPLVEFSRIEFQDGLVSLGVKGVWEPLLAASFSASQPLPPLIKPVNSIVESGKRFNLPTGLDLLPLR
jgi:hypothetical protein